MWIILIESAVIVLLIISMAYLYTYYQNIPEPQPATAPTCPSCPTLTSVVAKFKSDGSTIAEIVPVNLPPLLPGLSNGQYVSDTENGGIYYIQNNMLSYISNPTVLTRMSDYKGAVIGYPSASIAKMAFGTPILE